MTDSAETASGPPPVPLDARARLRASHQRLAAMAADLAEREAQVAALRGRLEFAETQRDEVQAATAQRLQGFERATQRVQNERDAALRELDRATQHLGRVEHRLAHVEDLLAESEAARTTLQATIDGTPPPVDHGPELASLRSQLSAMQAERDRNRAAAEQAAAAAAALQEQIDATPPPVDHTPELDGLRAEVRALTAQIAEDRVAVRAFQTAAAIAGSEAQDSREQAEAREAELAAVLVQLAAAQDDGARLAHDLEARLREATAQAARQQADHEATLLRVRAEHDAMLEELANERAVGAAQAEERAVELEQRVKRTAAERDVIEQRARVGRAEQLSRIRELEQLVSTLTVTLTATRQDVQRAEASRAWRLGHGVSRTASRLAMRPDKTDGALVAAMRRIDELAVATRALPPGRPAVLPPAPAPEDARRTAGPAPIRTPAEIAAERRLLAAEIRERLGPVPDLERWPPVSIVVPTRDGLALLQTLVSGLRDHTDYPAAELVVVDNGSADGSAEWLQACDVGMPVRVLVNAGNVSFSDAVTQGVEAAAHDLVLLLNNDVELFERGWLRELVASHETGGQVITGATLLHTEDTDARAAAGRLVQHRAIRLRRQATGVWPYNDGDGEDLFDDPFGVEQTVPAVSAACLLVSADQLGSLGGLSPRYRYGLEDVDLGLRATDAGLRVVACGRAILYHRESVTRTAEGSAFREATRTSNRRALLERWGPSLRSAHAQGRLAGDRCWTADGGPRAAIVITSLDEADGWGDWYTGRELGEALGALGWRVSYVARDGEGWTPLPHDADYVVTLLDRFDARLVPADVTVIAWIRNWTDRWLQQPWFARLDVLLASSPTTAGLIKERTGRDAELFPLATNPARFAVAAHDPTLAVDCVFSGNHWGKDRAIQAGLRPGRGQSLAIRGRGWETVKGLAAHCDGPATYDELPALYASATLVLDDTQPPTLDYDAVNARVFDALAAGALVLTNCRAGVRELFDDDFPTWETGDELVHQRDALLRDTARRTELATRYRAIVLAEHTYAHRARQLVEILRGREELPSFCIKIGAPDWEQAQRWGDLYFARGIERDLRRRGHRVLIQVLEEWEAEEGLTYDVVLHLKGLSRHFPKPGQFNILWSISHPAELTGEECDGYDLVAIASPSFAEVMRERTTTPVIVLEQATDPAVFFPDPDPAYAHDVLYVANSRGVLRRMMADLLPTDLDLAVYGANWEGLIDMKYVVAEHVPNDELRKLYSSAKVVLCDHWDDMREHGYIANRVYDALACGATVISDDVVGLNERFEGHVHTYDSSADLSAIVRQLTGPLWTPSASTASGAAPTFGARVDRLVEAVDASRRF